MYLRTNIPFRVIFDTQLTIIYLCIPLTNSSSSLTMVSISEATGVLLVSDSSRADKRELAADLSTSEAVSPCSVFATHVSSLMMKDAK